MVKESITQCQGKPLLFKDIHHEATKVSGEQDHLYKLLEKIRLIQASLLEGAPVDYPCKNLCMHFIEEKMNKLAMKERMVQL
jgi:hypothetical protein